MEHKCKFVRHRGGRKNREAADNAMRELFSYEFNH